MNPKYFKDKIYVELNESEDYMKKAMDYVKSYPEWSNSFRVMSDDRYNHAERLFKMFLELYTNSKGQEAYMSSLRDAIVEMFADKTRLIDGYRATYDMLADHGEEETGNE